MEIQSLRQALVTVADLTKTAKLVADQEKQQYEEKIFELENHIAHSNASVPLFNIHDVELNNISSY